MRPTISQYAQALEELSLQAPSQAQTFGKNLVRFLKRRGESGKIPNILLYLEQLELHRKKEVVVSVSSAHALTKEMEAQVLKKTAELFPGKTTVLTHIVDPSVIGGICLRSKELLYDATLAEEVLTLKKAIK